MAKVQGDCSGCRERFTLDLDALTVTMRVPGNRVRGKGHVPAHTVTAEATVDQVTELVMWDCPFPGCGYAESEEPWLHQMS